MTREEIIHAMRKNTTCAFYDSDGYEDDINLMAEKEMDMVAKALEKLAHYEDLEEAGRLIELPCKIGDTVYGIRRYHGIRIVQSGIVSEMYFSRENRLIIVIKRIGRGYWGESIFGSFEEAEAALKKRESE